MTKSAGRHYVLPGTALLCGVFLACVCVSHIRESRFPAGWDEAQYINRICLDRSVFRRQGIAGLATSFLLEDRSYPPGYRLAASLADRLTEQGPASLRLLALFSLFSSASMLFMAGREIAGTGAGVLWASLFSFSIGTVWASSTFGTETTLYPTVAGCLYALARWFGRGRFDSISLSVLTVSAAMGALSKASFFVVLVPLIVAAMLLAPDRSRWRKDVPAAVGALVAGVTIAIPWWLVNVRPAIAYAIYASGYVRHDFPWLGTAATDLLGPPFAVSLVFFIMWMLARAGEKFSYRTSNIAARNLVLACFAGCLPLVVLHIAGANHNMRLITPALMVAGAMVAIPLELSGLLNRRMISASLALILVAQVGFVIWSMQRSKSGPLQWDQWDWGKLRELARDRGLTRPSIVHLGNGAAFNPAQIEFPWACRDGEKIQERWLWRYEDGPIDWTKINRETDRADIVLTAPGFLGAVDDKQPLDNRYNSNLAEMLRKRATIWTATTLHPDETGDDRRSSVFSQAGGCAAPPFYAVTKFTPQGLGAAMIADEVPAGRVNLRDRRGRTLGLNCA
jgi:hypothetical protein